jgi:hypothetical protein
MIKLLDILNASFQYNKPLINECVIAYIELDGKTILCKNRDRMYTPDLKVIHELVDGVEVCYIYDTNTDYSEGMNSNGLAIVNSALLVKDDEKAGADKHKTKSDSTEKSQTGYDGLKIRTALESKNLKEALRSILTYTGEDKKDVGVKGFTMVSTPKSTYIIEATSQNLPIVTKIKPETKVSVRTNHGIHHKDAGYLEGEKRTSSLSRYDLSKQKLKQTSLEEEVLDILKGEYTDNYNNPYRRGGEKDMTTTSQLKMNVHDLTFELRPDKDNCNFMGYENKLPEEYTPKIKVKIHN